MLQNGAEMDCRSFVLALKACEQFLRVLGGKSVHCGIRKMGFASAMLFQDGLARLALNGNMEEDDEFTRSTGRSKKRTATRQNKGSEVHNSMEPVSCNQFLDQTWISKIPIMIWKLMLRSKG
jgi:hypothetical protein